MSRHAARFAAIIAPAVVAFSPGATAQSMPSAALSCSGCHHRASSDSLIPRLEGRASADFIAAMEAFRSGTREATVMGRIAKGFSEVEIRTIAEWYAREGAK